MTPFRIVVLAALLAPAAAAAQEPQTDLNTSTSGGERPWARDVPEAEQQRASALFEEGNERLGEGVFVMAAERYREALRHWNHPAIHYNLALALLNLDQPIEVHGHLVEAMRYGPEPLDPDKFEHARRYRALVEKQLTRLEVVCDRPGATVTMDGRPLFTSPGRWEGLVRAGEHAFAATRAGFVTTHMTPSLPAGRRVRLSLPLFTAEELTRYRRRWRVWQPWAVAAGGAAVLLAGGLLHWQAVESFQRYDERVVACGGCIPDPTLVAIRDRGETEQTLAITSYVIGGAALAAGAALLYLNRPYAYRVEADAVGKVSVLPQVGPRASALVLTVRF